MSFKKLRCGVLVAGALLLSTASVTAQEPAQDQGAKPASGAQDQPQKPPAKPVPNKDSATTSAQDQPAWDPTRAEKDLEVGQYYMHKGDVDAAIDRFQDATTAKPGYAIPFRFLGEAQERKGLKRDALKSYTRYLELFPAAEDREKIEKKVAKLRSEVEKSKK